MAIKILPIEKLNKMGVSTIAAAIGIEITAVDEKGIEGMMPVDSRTHQIHGVLHGGASVVLAETLGSLGAMLTIDIEKFRAVGIDVNANHLRPVASGWVVGRAEPVHVGRTTQVWDIRLRDQDERLVCISRLTVAIIPNPS